MAKDIPRGILRQMTRDYKANGLAMPTNKLQNVKQSSLFIKNSTGSLLKAGSYVSLSGYATSLSYTVANSKLLGNNLILCGVPLDTSLVIASVIRPIKANQIGEVKCEGVEFVIVHINDATHWEATIGRESVASNGALKIIAKSGLDENNNSICAVKTKVAYNTETITYATGFLVIQGTIQLLSASKTVIVP